MPVIGNLTDTELDCVPASRYAASDQIQSWVSKSLSQSELAQSEEVHRMLRYGQEKLTIGWVPDMKESV